MLLPVLVVLVRPLYTNTSFFFLLTSCKSKLKVNKFCGLFKLMTGECILFYLRKQCQKRELNMKNWTVLLQGKMLASHQRSLNSASKSNILVTDFWMGTNKNAILEGRGINSADAEDWAMLLLIKISNILQYLHYSWSGSWPWHIGLLAAAAINWYAMVH